MDSLGMRERSDFTYDGDTITPFALNDPMLRYDGNYVGYVFEYLGTTYVSGSLWDPILEQPHSFMRWNGNALEDVPGWPPPVAPIKDILIHDGQLYVCGWFFEVTGGPGNMVARFDGQQWHTLGSGLWDEPPPSTYGVALDLHEWNGDIYVGGDFSYAGGVPAMNAARWNGSQWCGLGGVYNIQASSGSVSSFTIWRDSLYIAGGFVTIDGDTMWNVARWLGQVENCSEPVAVEEVTDGVGEEFLQLVPVESGVWRVRLPEGGSPGLEVHDAMGRLIFSNPLARNGSLLDLRQQASGIYVARCTTSEGGPYSTRVRR